MEFTLLSPREKTLSMISCSSSSITPAVVPWSIRMRISSSVTAGSVVVLDPQRPQHEIGAEAEQDHCGRDEAGESR